MKVVFTWVSKGVGASSNLDSAGNGSFNIQIPFFLNIKYTGVFYSTWLFLHGERPLTLLTFTGSVRG
jgi:hypothetical protein